MKWESGDATLYCGDCMDIMPTLGEVDLVFADPPYNIGKADWDKIEDYEDWCAEWIALASDVLKANGALWISHSKPLVLAKLSEMVKGRGLRNWITWDKLNGNPAHQACGGPLVGMTECAGLRSWQPMAEYLIYHADESEWASQCDKERGFIFEPLREYLASERDRAGWKNGDINRAWREWKNVNSTSQTQKWFSNSCFNPPTREAYEWLRQLFNQNGTEYLKRDYEDLKRDYEDLRQEFEGLRYTFNNPGKMSSVWQIPPAGANGHETPKPVELLLRIVRATSNEGDTVLDPFMGSGTTGVACVKEGRKFIGIDIDEEYFELSKKRIQEAQAQPVLL